MDLYYFDEVNDFVDIDSDLQFTESDLRNVRKNKRSRQQKKDDKFKRRVKMFNSTKGENNPYDYSNCTALKNTSTICSCPICKGERYGKKDRRKGWNEAFEEYSKDQDALVFPDF